MLSPADMNRLISEWLARAHPMPERAREEWSRQGVALLPLGRLFSAVRMPGDLVFAAVGAADQQEAAVSLREWLKGPVIHDHRAVGATYYALINWGAAVIQGLEPDDVAPYLGTGTYLGVPRIDRREPPGTYWVVPPQHDGHLCRPAAVRSFIAAGRQELSQRATA